MRKTLEAGMTSEVVLLNKDAIVIAADSAVTVGRDPHPRYSKSANKIFDASRYGNLAIAIFSGAEVDGVPWELAIKQFRAADSDTAQRGEVADYIPAAMTFLQGNPQLFPAQWLAARLKTKLAVAAMQVYDDVKAEHHAIDDPLLLPEDGRRMWTSATDTFRRTLAGLPLAGGLSEENFFAVQQRREDLAEEVNSCLPQQVRAFVEPDSFYELAVEYAFRAPHHVFSSTGLVFAGYGANQIFPAFHSITVYGHIGSEICFTPASKHIVDHANGAWIQPFAKFSMIQRFTDGFDYKQQLLFRQTVTSSMATYAAKLRESGIEIDDGLSERLVAEIADSSVTAWTNENYNENFHPLRHVLNSLSVQEMAELAETLLVLESLRERVTSPSETVGGPVDVAAITKSDGLVWIRRKHYFAPKLNLRYLERIRS